MLPVLHHLPLLWFITSVFVLKFCVKFNDIYGTIQNFIQHNLCAFAFIPFNAPWVSIALLALANYSALKDEEQT